jgi:hypothetical protein
MFTKNKIIKKPHNIFVWLSVMIYLVLSTFSFELKAQVDYIKSGYYQLIYKADWAYLNENYDSAFFYYQQAEKTAPMLNQSTYYEQENYASMLIKRGLYEQGFSQLADLIQRNRTTFSAFCDRYLSDVDTASFAKFPQWKNLSSIIPNKTDSLTIAILKSVYDNEQAYQSFRATSNREKPLSQSQLNYCDSLFCCNFNLMLELLNKRHFPGVDDVGVENIELINILETIAWHISNYRDYLRDTILKNIELGYCSPTFLSGLFERASLDNKITFNKWSSSGWSYYGTMANIVDDDVFDIENLDKRRLEIGLPTWEQQKSRHEFFVEKMRQMSIEMPKNE